jgi:non-ribosomal peptide synthetase component F
LGWPRKPALALGELTLEGVAEPSHFAKFDLSLSLSESNGIIRGSLEYATALFDQSTVERFVGYFQRLLQAMVGNDQALLERRRCWRRRNSSVCWSSSMPRRSITTLSRRFTPCSRRKWRARRRRGDGC